MIHNVIKPNTYFDSVTLMLFSSKLNSVNGIEQAAVMMGTNHNKELMINSGVLTKDQADKAGSNDLIIGIKAGSQTVIDQAIKVLNEQFENKTKPSNAGSEIKVKTVEAAVKAVSDLNFAVVSLPGRFAKAEAMKCLQNNMHVLLFSDNVSLEDEVELKDYAVKNELLMMGPDCGTAIVNGVALGFANVVKRGNIGLVAASGTGLQEVTVIIDKLGGGISQALGTGGRDLKLAVGGKMMLSALDALNADPATEVIGIISKPPAPEVMVKILEKVNKFKKPVVVCFLGGDKLLLNKTKVFPVENLEQAASALVALANKQEVPKNSKLKVNYETLINNIKLKQIKGKYVRGVYTGGTLAYESMLILSSELSGVYSNIATDKKYNLDNPHISKENSVVDMGEDFFTDGQPHPMIDPKQRSLRIISDARDKDTAIILFDCVLGYGSHDNPSESIVKAIKEVKNSRGESIVFVGSVTGTDRDPQVRGNQEKMLTEAGAIILPTNAQAAAFVVTLVSKIGAK
jgi:succinyl-CoA synthetase alpha subunit